MKLILFAAAAASCLIAIPAAAQIKIIDQSNTDTGQITPSPGMPAPTRVSNGISVPSEPNGRVGQSFTPTLPSLNFFTFDIFNIGSANRNADGSISSNPSIATSLAVYLYSGMSKSGNPLAISQSVLIPANAPRTTVQFDFTNPVALTPSLVYSAYIFDLTNLANPSVYPGASAFSCNATYAGGQGVPGGDLCFSEGISTPDATGSVPEPATWSMMMLGFGGMGYAMRRKMKVAARIRFA